MSHDLPVIGAALSVPELATFRDWVLEKHRDVELQSFDTADVLNGDWAPMAAEARRLLIAIRAGWGFTGRSGALPSTAWIWTCAPWCKSG